jgi:hypothetical protein
VLGWIVACLMLILRPARLSSCCRVRCLVSFTYAASALTSPSSRSFSFHHLTSSPHRRRGEEARPADFADDGPQQAKHGAVRAHSGHCALVVAAERVFCSQPNLPLSLPLLLPRRSQIGFIDHIVKPLYVSLEKICPDVKVSAASRNRRSFLAVSALRTYCASSLLLSARCLRCSSVASLQLLATC